MAINRHDPDWADHERDYGDNERTSLTKEDVLNYLKDMAENNPETKTTHDQRFKYHCKYCKETGFEWRVEHGKWVLYDYLGEKHDCRSGSFFNERETK